MALAFTLPNAYAQNETRTFFRCYTSFSSAFMMFNELTPTTVNLTDPQVKAYISNLCNFYHEKIGIWIEFFTDKPDPKLGEEFNQKYGSTMPDSIKEFANMSVLN